MSATTQSTPTRHLIAAGIKRGAGSFAVEQPQLSAADKAAHAAASYVRRQQAIAHSLQAAVLADEAGDPDYAAGFRADADRMRQALTS